MLIGQRCLVKLFERWSFLGKNVENFDGCGKINCLGALGDNFGKARDEYYIRLSISNFMTVVHIPQMQTQDDNSVMEGGGSRFKRGFDRPYSAEREDADLRQFKARRRHLCPCDLCRDGCGRCLCDCAHCLAGHPNRDVKRIMQKERHRVRYLHKHRCPCDTCLSSEEEEDLDIDDHSVAGDCRNPTKDGLPCLVSCSYLERK